MSMTMRQVIEKKGKLIEQLREAVTSKDYDQEKVDLINKDINACDHQKTAIENAEKLIADKPQPSAEQNDNFRTTLDEFCRTGRHGKLDNDYQRGIAFDLIAPETRAYDWNKTTGAYLVPSEVGSFIQEAMTYTGGMITPGLCTWLRTSTGRAIAVPTVDDTSSKGAVVSESTAMTSGSAVTYGTSTLTFYKITSHIATVSNELLQDAAFDVGAHVIKILTERLMRGLNYYFTLGSGSSQPYGIQVLSTKGVDGSTRTVSRTNITDLIYSVNRAYRSGAAFQMEDSVIGAIRALYIGSADARPLWQDSMQAGEPNRLEGYPVIANPDMDELNAYNFPVFFGDWKRYYIGEALPLKLIRLTEYYAPSDQVGFCVLGRWAGNLVAYTGDAPIKHIRNAST